MFCVYCTCNLCFIAFINPLHLHRNHVVVLVINSVRLYYFVKVVTKPQLRGQGSEEINHVIDMMLYNNTNNKSVILFCCVVVVVVHTFHITLVKKRCFPYWKSLCPVNWNMKHVQAGTETKELWCVRKSLCQKKRR